MAEALPRVFQNELIDGHLVRLIPHRFEDGMYHLHERVGKTSNRKKNVVPVATEDELIERLITDRYSLRLEREDGRSIAPTMRAPQRLNIPEIGQVQEEGNRRHGRARIPETQGGDDGPYQPDGVDRRPYAKRQVRQRQGQHNFKVSLIARYGAACMVSGCGVFEVMEAAHILQYLGPNDNHRENGILLRADLHSLFDSDLMGIEPDSLLVRFHPALRNSEYWEYDGTSLRCGDWRPSLIALQTKWGYYEDRLRLRD